MGCDIHAHTEIKIDGTWHHFDQPRFNRNYMLFARMAGVCGGYSGSPKPIAKPRGLPADCAFITKYDSERWAKDAHSHSWLSAAEVVELGEWMEQQHKSIMPNEHWYCEKVLGYVFNNCWNQFTKYRDELPSGVQDARIVFWFYN